MKINGIQSQLQTMHPEKCKIISLVWLSEVAETCLCVTACACPARVTLYLIVLCLHTWQISVEATPCICISYQHSGRAHPCREPPVEDPAGLCPCSPWSLHDKMPQSTACACSLWKNEEQCHSDYHAPLKYCTPTFKFKGQLFFFLLHYLNTAVPYVTSTVWNPTLKKDWR